MKTHYSFHFVHPFNYSTIKRQLFVFLVFPFFFIMLFYSTLIYLRAPFDILTLFTEYDVNDTHVLYLIEMKLV